MSPQERANLDRSPNPQSKYITGRNPRQSLRAEPGLSKSPTLAGRTTGVPDAIIAATAIGHGLTLVTLNRRDFQHVAGLSLYQTDPQEHL